LVSFRNIEQKDKIMSNLRNLKQPVEKFQGISICHELHPKERQERKRLVESAKQQHADQCDDSAENYRFIVVGSIGEVCEGGGGLWGLRLSPPNAVTEVIKTAKR